MILTGESIKREVGAGSIVIDPFDERCLNPNSYNYHLGPVVRVYDTTTPLDMCAVPPTRTITLDQNGFVFLPRRVYLGSTVETIGSGVYVPSLIGRSSLGRLGVFLQISADLGNLGAVHTWTLEIVVTQPIRMYPGMRVGQVSFWVPDGALLPYAGYFGSRSGPVPPPSLEGVGTGR